MVDSGKLLAWPLLSPPVTVYEYVSIASNWNVQIINERMGSCDPCCIFFLDSNWAL